MFDFDTQKELLKETVPPKVAIHLEIGAQNQQKINQNFNTNAQSVKIVNNFLGRNLTTNYQNQPKDYTHYPTVPQNYQNISFCGNCGQCWSHNHF